MTAALQILVDALSLGSLYALAALGVLSEKAISGMNRVATGTKRGSGDSGMVTDPDRVIRMRVAADEK